MNSKEFRKYLDRDKWCPHCGTTETLVPQHRANRGHGGSKAGERPSNVIVLCALFNGLIESDAKAAGMAKRYGWKLSRYDNPLEQPVYDVIAGNWFLLGDDFTKAKLVT